DSRPLFIVELDIINDTNWILQNGHCIGALLIDTNVVVAGAFVSGVDDVPWRMALRLTVTHRGCELLWWEVMAKLALVHHGGGWHSRSALQPLCPLMALGIPVIRIRKCRWIMHIPGPDCL